MKLLPPIYSAFDDDVELREAIEAFVVSLADRIDAMQDAHSAWDRTALRSLSNSLQTNAERLGYPQLAELAGHTDTATGEDRPEDARKRILEMTELVQRIRRGSRSSA